MKTYMPTRVFTGDRILFQHKDLFKKTGQRCLIITSPHAGRSSGMRGCDDQTSVTRFLKNILMLKQDMVSRKDSCGHVGFHSWSSKMIIIDLGVYWYEEKVS